MNIYSDKNPPKRGTGLKIYKALKSEGWTVEDLHYNPSLWGKLKTLGYGTWACKIANNYKYWELWCGVYKNTPYLQSCISPFNCFKIEGSYKFISH